MLVLTRRLNEQIQIGDNITVSILRIKGNTVRVGIEAPRQVRVVRGELPPKVFGEETPRLSELSESDFCAEMPEGAGDRASVEAGEGEGVEEGIRGADGLPQLSQRARLALAAWDLATDMLGS